MDNFSQETNDKNLGNPTNDSIDMMMIDQDLNTPPDIFNEDVFPMSVSYQPQITEVEMSDITLNYQPPREDLITSNETNFLIQEATNIYFQDPSMQEKYKTGDINQTEEEKRFLKEISVCPMEKLDFYNESLANVDPDSLKRAVSKQFFNPNVMESVMCLVDSFFYVTPGFKPHQRVRNWLSNLKRIGTESVSGYALRGTFSSNKDEESDDNEGKLFIIKTPRSSKFNDELIHEAFVGMFGLNNLRRYIPNFTYVYGLFECSPALIDPVNKNVDTWCTTSGNTNYLVIENIAPAISLSVYTRTASPKEFVSIYLQTLYALRTALVMGNFTHYDLHNENVLIREITQLGPGKSAAIPYNTERGMEYWIGSRIATIIDYGRVHIKFANTDYGFWKIPYYFVFPNQSFALYDAYKLLGFSMRDMLNSGNTASFNEAAKILKFFNLSEDPVQFIRVTEKNLFSLPYTQKVQSKSLDDLLVHIREVCDTSSYLRPDRENYPLLYCDEDTICLSEPGVIRKIGVDQISLPRSVFQFCDLIMKIRNDPTKSVKYQEIIDHLTQTQSYIPLLNKAITDFNSQANQINQKYSLLGNTKYKINGIPLEVILNENAYTQYRQYVFNVVNLVGLITDLNTLLEAYQCTLQNLPDLFDYSQYNQYIPDFKYIISQYVNQINPYINLILQDIVYVLKLKDTRRKEIESVLNSNNKFSWYWTTFPSFEYLQNVFR